MFIFCDTFLKCLFVLFKNLNILFYYLFIFSEAGCTPFVASILADIYSAELRGTALGIYNWGLYLGYSLSYALGNTITSANINGQVWKFYKYDH